MKLNFIQNLSDEVIKENYSLKNEVIQYKKRLTVQQILKEFNGLIKSEINDANKTRINYLSLKDQFEEFKKAHGKIMSEMSLMKKDQLQIRKTFAQEKHELQQKLAKTILYSQSQKEEIKQLEKQITKVKIEKLVLEEKKRKQLDLMREQSYKDFMHFKEKMETEHTKTERDLREQIEIKEKNIKKLNTYFQKFKISYQSDVRDLSVLEKVLISIQQYTDQGKTIQQLTRDNLRHQQTIKRLSNQNLNLQLRIRDAKSSEASLITQHQKITLQKIQLQRQVLDKINAIRKLQKQKEDMEHYYDEKWRDDYQRVKHQLEKHSSNKITKIEDNYNRNMKQIQCKLEDATNYMLRFQARNQELQERYNSDQAQIMKARAQIEELHIRLKQQIKRIQQIQNLSFQDTCQLILKAKQQAELRTKMINELKNQLSAQKQNLVKLHLQQVAHLAELQKQYQQKLKEQELIANAQRNRFIQQHQQHIQKIKDQHQQRQKQHENHKEEIRKVHRGDIQKLTQNHHQQIQKRQAEYQRKYERWADKSTQMRNIITMLTAKAQQQKDMRKQQTQQFDISLAKLRDQGFNDEQCIKQLQQEIERNRSQVNRLHLIINQRILEGKEKDLLIKNLQQDVAEGVTEVKALYKSRESWIVELKLIEKQYKAQFEALRKFHDKQIYILKGRIKELQEISQKRMINQRDYQSLRRLTKEANELKSEVYLKQTENIILCQVKEYYETKLKEAQLKIGKSLLRNTNSIFYRKPKRARPQQSISQINLKLIQQKDIQEGRRYMIDSARKKYEIKEVRQVRQVREVSCKDSQRRLRVNTTVS